MRDGQIWSGSEALDVLSACKRRQHHPPTLLCQFAFDAKHLKLVCVMKARSPVCNTWRQSGHNIPRTHNPEGLHGKVGRAEWSLIVFQCISGLKANETTKNVQKIKLEHSSFSQGTPEARSVEEKERGQ